MVSFGIVGGDKRQLYLARSLKEDGYAVCLHGLEELEGAEEFPSLSLEEMGRRCDVILLPLPATRDGVTLNAPFSREPILLNDKFAEAFRNCHVLGGMVGKVGGSSSLWEGISLEDYYQREELTLGNAFLTAEGAVALAVQEYPGALGGSHCLVTGFGRIGKSLCLALRGLGARVDCCARKPRDLTAIRALGCTPLEYSEVKDRYDVIFNTVPALVVGEEILSRQGPDTLLLELASAPGGIHRQAAERCGLRVVDAPSLPGRFSPKASGELIKEAVYHMLKERRKL
jgi:dipicolinate synthase subunit A